MPSQTLTGTSSTATNGLPGLSAERSISSDLERLHRSRSNKGDLPRVALTIADAAAAMSMSEATFRRLVVSELRVIHAGPRTTLVRQRPRALVQTKRSP